MTATAPAPIRHANDGVTFLHLNQLRESNTNPRRTFDKKPLEELAQSIRDVGIVQPLLVRLVCSATSGGVTVGEHFEIVAGARRFRAAKAAALLEVPCFVRQLDDRQVLEIQYVENLQREDLHPLEEGHGYAKLHDTHGYSVEQLAAKLGKSKAYVYSRMQLGKLPAKAQTLFLEGKIDLSHAQLVARIPVPALADKAAADIAKGYPGREKPMSYRDAVDHLRRNYQCDLSAAPFPQGDKELVPAAGACGDCPKRSGNQKGLFDQPDESADVCTDPKCFALKASAFWSREKAAAKARGDEVLEDKAAEQAHYGGEFVDPTSTCFADAKYRKWKQLAKGQKVKRVLFQDRNGRIVERWRKADATKAARANGHLKPEKKSKAKTSGGARVDHKEQARISELVDARAVPALVAAAEKLDVRAFCRLVLRNFASAYASTHCEKRRGLDLETTHRRGVIQSFSSKKTRDQLEAMTAAELQGLAIEMWADDPYEAELLCDELGVDRKAIAKAVAAEEKAAALNSKTMAPVEARNAKGKPKGKAKKAAKPKPDPKSPAREGKPTAVQIQQERQQAATRAANADEPATDADRCRGCGCTEHRACVVDGMPCHWAEPGLCSACAGPQPQRRSKKHGSKPKKGEAPPAAADDEEDLD